MGKVSNETESTTVVNENDWLYIVKKIGSAFKSRKTKRSYLLGYKSYVALLTQTGTSAPSAIVLDNSLGFTPVWSYDSQGSYFLTYSGGFTTNKTTVLINQNRSNRHNAAYWNDSNSITVETSVISTNTLADDILENTLIEIRVYY